MKNKEYANYSSSSCNTKEIILSAAKQQFSEQGYLKTTIASIFELIDVPMGVFTYHFKTKDNLVREIHVQFYKQINDLVESNLNVPQDNYFLRHLLNSRIFYKVILENEKNSRFYYEVLYEKSNYRFNSGIVIPKLRKYLEEFNVLITEEEFQSIVLLNAGARREFFLNYFEKKIILPVDDVVNLLEGFIPRMFKIDQNLIDSIILKSMNLTSSLDYSSIKFLV
ncbi:DNA-binding transcriptional repressor AcrR [Oxobacter pfennigii]|uniref:DNA-binding transcriptional repressor AcrR n=1 Tax=Oxobacter pfennigii TaxID=36849 RepID=A0A0P8YEJ5_9CLOT|nr:TetR/AcrR family transcriptional regulator [Oxobacter pfennigii]KPU45638.1 DNA-binding transcriptional repressor AcrR [Oxobacter pfennigii]